MLCGTVVASKGPYVGLDVATMHGPTRAHTTHTAAQLLQCCASYSHSEGKRKKTEVHCSLHYLVSRRRFPACRVRARRRWMPENRQGSGGGAPLSSH